jgi:hypothetical protein
MLQKYSLIKSLAEEKGILRPRDLSEYNIHREYLTRLCELGQLEKIGRGLYTLPNLEIDENLSLAQVSKSIPNSTISLLSALRFHNLTTQLPFEVWIAIPNKAHQPSLKEISIRVVRFSGDAIFLHLRATFQMKLATRKYFQKDNTWQDDWKIINQLLRKASQAPSIFQLFSNRDSRIFAMLTDAILLKVPSEHDLNRITQLRKDTSWILDEGQLRSSERKKFIPLLVDFVKPEMGRYLLIDWKEKEPKNLAPVKLMAQLELRAGNYAAALKTANSILTQQPNNQDMQKVKKSAVEEMQKTLESISPPLNIE